jgi:hypothetical protein
MKPIHVRMSQDAAYNRITSTADGLASAYQRTNITTAGVMVAETAGGFLLPEIVLPWFQPIPLEETFFNTLPYTLPLNCDELAEGYKAMAAENDLLAEEFLPIALEEWPAWKE